MKRIFFLGAVSNINLDTYKTNRQRFKLTGNTGNMLVGNALQNQLKYTSLGGGISSDPKYVEDNFDCIIIAATNFLHQKFDFSHYASFLERVDLPCFIMGLGAQAPSFDHKVDIQKGTLRMVQIVAERSKSIGVRGYFTAEVLNKLNIKNVKVIGCPSFYSRLSSDLKINKKQFNDKLRIIVNGSRNVYKHSLNQDAAINLEKKIFQFALEHNCPYILQNEIPEMYFINNEMQEEDDKNFEHLKKFYGFKNKEDEFKTFIRENMKIFFSVQNWKKFVSEYDFVFGSRFHGNMIALLNGIPGLIFVHDSRTREMCELMHIPHILITDIDDINFRLLYEMADYSALEIAYNSLLKKYINFLEENGLEHNLTWKPYYPKGSRMSGYSWLSHNIKNT